MKNQTKKIGAFIAITLIAFVITLQLTALLAIGVLFIAVLIAGIWENNTICHSSNQINHSSYFLQH